MSAVPQAIQPAQTLESLADAWARAKHEEDEANRRRVDIEARIIAIAGEREEGSETHALADGRKLTITAKMTRSIDETIWRQVMNQIPAEMHPVRYESVARLDTTGLKWLRENRPEFYAIAARAITAKKSKSSLTLKVA